MSYPFGSGMPPLPNSGNSAYPPQQPHNFGSGGGYPPFPQSNSGYPSQQYSHQGPSQQPNVGFGAHISYPSQPGYGSHTSYPSQQPSYPSSQHPSYPSSLPPSYPPQQSSYPSMPSMPSMPNSTGYTTQSHNPYPSSQNQGYGHAGFQQSPSISSSGYQGMVNVFSEMQGHIKDTRKSKGNPTLVPAQNFDPVADSNALRKAMKGFGTDEDGLIEILCRRSNEQRQIIQRTYKTNFGKDLIEDICSETSGNFENLLVALLTPIVDFYVKELHDAMAGIGTDEDVLIEVLCSMSNYEIHTIKNAYLRMYGKNLESELISETSGNFKRLLVSLCAASRDESGVVDPDAARRDATELLRAGELRVGTDESTFNMVFCQRNYAQIKLICEEYRRMTGHGLEQAIRNEFSGDIMDGLIAILQCTSNKGEFFASRLHKSMAGIGTNDQQLIRIVVTRCEIDLNDIKAAFERLYGKNLRSWIKGDTSGHYKHALYALIGEQRSS